MLNGWRFKVDNGKSHQAPYEINTPKPEVVEHIHIAEKSRVQRIIDGIKSFSPNKTTSRILKWVGVMLPILAVLMLAKEIQRRQSLNSQAGVNQARIFFQATNLTFPPDNSFGLLLNTEGALGFVKIEINYDPSKVRLLNEIDVSPSPFKRVIKVSSKDEANQTGKIDIILGIDPSNVFNPPLGDIEISRFNFGSNTGEENISSSITINTSNSQIVGLDSVIFSLTKSDINLIINPVATPVATVMPTILPTNAPTELPTTAPTMQSTIIPLPTVVPASCDNCHKRKCDNVCDSKREDISCSDCR